MIGVYKGARVLVTGGSGVIGTELIEMLSAADCRILNIDRVARDFSKKNVESLTIDLLDTEAGDLIRDFSPNYVFHLAASFERTAEESGYWRTSYRDNVAAGQRTLEALVDCKDMRRLIFASSYLRTFTATESKRLFWMKARQWALATSLVQRNTSSKTNLILCPGSMNAFRACLLESFGSTGKVHVISSHGGSVMHFEDSP
jgi:NAD(P)-dependent dehydrogenase (short-subunit alcohol dehydrogenase family)